MIYQYIQPDPCLKEFVRNYLIAHFVFDPAQTIPFKPYSPKPEQTITFLPKGGLTIEDPLTGIRLVAPSISICGQQVSRYNFYLTQKYLMLRVHFNPGALYRLICIPLFEFTDGWYDAEQIIHHEIAEINERLADCTTYRQMITTVEEYLIRKIKKSIAANHPLDQVATWLYNNPSRFSLDWLAKESGLCSRQFNRRFTERMGVGPKLYSRIVRFYQAYEYKETHPHDDWLTIALLFGYTDYQHLVKDFTRFSHATPNLWIRQDNQSPERILRLE